jgi:hypothetical protein
MPLLMNNELARRENGKVELRSGPVRVRWNLDDLVTSDGHKLHCAFTCSATALGDATERRMLEEVFLGRGQAVTTDAVVAHFAPALRAAAGKVAGKHTAAEWVEGDLKQPMIDGLCEAARRVAFSAGLEILAPFDVAFESPSFHSQKVEEMERTLAERRVAGQVAPFERASRLLKEFKDLREAAPELSPADILKQISPADQGQMLQTLLLAAGKDQAGGASLWAVAGNALVKVDGRATPVATEMMALPETLGPLRSVQPARVDGQEVLLIGARSGVMTFDPETRATQAYRDASIDSQLGFSKALTWDGKIWACHGDAGVVAWTPGQFDAPSLTIRPGQLRGSDNPPPLPTMASPTGSQSISTRTSGIRNLTVLDDTRLVLSVGHALTVIDGTGTCSLVPMAGYAEIIALFVEGMRVVVVQEDGTINLLDRATLNPLSQQRRSGRLSAAALLPWLGANRLLLASDAGPIYCTGLDDEVVTTYLSSHRGLRVVTAAADLVAAVSSDRQRIVLWHSWEGKQPVAELSIAGLARHRVGDVEFA